MILGLNGANPNHLTAPLRCDTLENARARAREHQKRAEDATKALLARWVSELPATIAYDEEYRVIGASYGGEIVLRLALAEPTAPR